MTDDDRHLRPTGIFAWNPLATDEGIDAYLRDVRATGDEELIEEAEFLSTLARQLIAKEVAKA